MNQTAAEGAFRGRIASMLGTLALLISGVLPDQVCAQDGSGTPDVQQLLDRAETVYESLESLQAQFEQTIATVLKFFK